MKVVLSLTHRCNLACRYCYGGTAYPRDMSFETAQKVVDFGIAHAGPGEPIEYHFFGGEPLLAFPLLQDTTAYIQQRSFAGNNPISLSVTTNGTVLTRAHCDFFKAAGFIVCISIDGPARLHNANRIYPGGRGSFDDIRRNLAEALARLENVQVNAVYGPARAAYLPEVMRTFVDLGLRSMHFNPDIRSSWSANDYETIRRSFMEMAGQYCDCYQNNHEIAVDVIDSKVILLLKGGYAARDICGMAHTQWAFAPSGNIYPCERLIGEDASASPFLLGNVHGGLARDRCQAIRAHVGNRNPECSNCRLRRYCMNWCGCTNYYLTGETDLTGPGLCAIQKASLQAAEYVITTLAACDAFADHFLGYLSTLPCIPAP